MGAKVTLATPEAALSAAILAAIEQPMATVLSDITFGRYANLENGWYWELKFTTTVGMTTGPGDSDAIERRVPAIITRWKNDVAKYAPGDDETGDQG